MLWAIPKPLAPMVRALNVRSVRAGTAEERQHKIALNWAMIKIAPEQGRAGAVKPATANINLALVIRAINTLAPARVTPVVPAPPAAENTSLVPAPAATSGKMVVANSKSLMALKATYSIAMELSSELKIVL